MNQVSQYIFLFLVGTTVLNFIIAVVARAKTGNREFNVLVLYWVSLFLNFVGIAVFSESVNEIALSFFFTAPPTALMAKMIRDSRKIKTNWPLVIGVELAGMVISTYLLFFTNAGFSYSLFPFIFAISWPWVYPIFDTLFGRRLEASWIEKTMALVYITGIMSHFAFAFYRLDEKAAWWGWSQAIAHYQCLSIILPLLINHRRERNERRQLEMALEKLSGQQTTTSKVDIDLLYRNLELLIGQKDDFSRQLSRTNGNLVEEREMNEILIKTISHDLANPLTVVNAYVDMLTSGKIAQEDFENIHNRMRLNLRAAMDMIDRIRKTIVKRSEAEIVKVVPVDLKIALQRTEMLFEERMREKKLSLQINGDPTGLQVLADENALVEHVFANILSNAVKFSYEDGQILIEIHQEQDKVTIEFRDYGVGLAPARLGKNRYFSTLGTRGEEGTGFGLIVMGYFIRQFGAELKIVTHTPRGEKGTSFFVSLNRPAEAITDTGLPGADKLR